MNFYIEKIIVTGAGKRDSIIELSKGLNIIYGPSNTGKTYIVKCIDYMFGSDKEPIDTSTGYQTIKMIVNNQYGSIHMSRKIGENKIEIISNDNRIASGTYNTKASRNNYEKTINFVWLSLIGVKDMHLIINNENFKKQILSWRIFCHMFMLTETKIISEYSTILSVRETSNTAVIASLIFLLTGQDFAETESIDSKEIKEAKKNATEEIIENDIKPQLSILKDKLSSYRLFIEQQKEIAILKQFSEQKVADMIDNESSDENEIKFKVKEHLDYNFINALTTGVRAFLEKCNYENLLSLTFDKATMDIVINGKKKGSNGKGYNAFFNSIVAIVLSRYMNNNAKFSSNLLVLDSPILSLKEKDAKKPSDTMKYALFENIVENQSEIQTIIVENEIPNIDYKSTKMIHFTKEKGNGRYGFLMDVTD